MKVIKGGGKMARIKDYAMNEGERLVSDTYRKVADGMIDYTDCLELYEDLSQDEKTHLEFIGIEDRYDFKEAVENE